MCEKLQEILEQTLAARLLEWKKLALVYVGNEADAEEVIQEACAATLKAKPPLETENEMHHYMRSAIKTSALKLLQGGERLVPAEDVGTSQVDARPNALDRVISAEDAAELTRLAARAQQLIRNLPESERTLVEDLLLRDPTLKFRDVSARDDVPLSTLHMRFKGILGRIAEAILSEAPDSEAVLRLIREEHPE